MVTHMRRLAITKRVSLEGLAEGWDDTCYALVTLATYAEFIGFTKLTVDNTAEGNVKLLEFQIDFVKKHLVTGTVKVVDDAGNFSLDAIKPEDIDASKELCDILFNAVTGVIEHPKATSTMTETSPTSEPTSDHS